MTQLDVKDRKILYWLSQNARISDTQLSRRVQLSKNGAKYRVERLQKEGIIKHFATTVNLETLGLTTVTVFLKFNDDIYENEKIISYFRDHTFVNWVASLSGEWDLLVEIVIKNLNDLHNTIKALLKEFSGILNSYKLLFSKDILRVEHITQDFYKGLNLKEMEPKKRKVEIQQIDVTDRHILQILSRDSTLPYLTIAQELGVKIDVVRYRMKKMEERGVIVKYFPEIDLKKLGYTEYVCELSLKNVTLEKLKSLQNQIKVNHNMTYAFMDLHNLTLVFVCAFTSPDGIDTLLRGLQKEFRSIIDTQKYMIIKEQILFNLFPSGLVFPR